MSRRCQLRAICVKWWGACWPMGRLRSMSAKKCYRAIEAVLPPEVRRQAVASRREVEKAEREEAKVARDQEREKERAAREQERQERQRDMPIAAANFMVAGVRYEGRAELISRYANTGDPVHVVRDRGNRYSRFAIAVMLENGEQIGFVPEEDAQRLAPLLDEGAKYAAWITKILNGGRVPIPVVQTRLYRTDLSVHVESTSLAQQTPTVSSERNEKGNAGGTALAAWLWIAAITVLLFVVLAR